MFDFGWQEFVMVAFVLVLVVGPKDLPKVLRGFTKFTSQARQMAREFTRSLEDVGKDENIREVKSMVADLKSGNLEDMARIVDDRDVTAELNAIKKDVDVTTIGDEVKAVQKAGRDEENKALKAAPKKSASQNKTKSKKA